LLSRFDYFIYLWGLSCRDRIVVGFSTTCTNSSYHH